MIAELPPPLSPPLTEAEQESRRRDTKHALDMQAQMSRKRGGSPDSWPTPDEIEQRARSIRENGWLYRTKSGKERYVPPWDEATYRVRAGFARDNSPVLPEIAFIAAILENRFRSRKAR